MGMSASQVRYLSLQNRNNTIGLNLLTLANRRTALERDMTRVANEYNTAISQKKLKWSSDSGITYKDISYDLLMNKSSGTSSMPYLITDANGRLVVDDKPIGNTGLSLKDFALLISDSNDANEIYVNGSNTSGKKSKMGYDNSSLSDPLVFNLLSRLNLISGLSSTKQGYRDALFSTNFTYGDTSVTNMTVFDYYNIVGGAGTYRIGSKSYSATDIFNMINAYQYDTSMGFKDEALYYNAIFKYIAENGWVYDPDINSSNATESREVLQAKLKNNIYYITEVKNGILDKSQYSYDTKIASNCSGIYECFDTDAQNVALSRYEAEKADIQSKEKQIDLRMNKLETEQSAIKTELDSIKNIINDNVNSTFKIFT